MVEPKPADTPAHGDGVGAAGQRNGTSPGRKSRRRRKARIPRRIVISAQKARQGDIILDTPVKRRWFIGVLVVSMLAAAVLAFIF